MIRTPLSFADTPLREKAPQSRDLLSDVLSAVHLTGAVFLNARFTAPFGVISPKTFDAGMPMAHLRHVSVFHLITAGECTIESAGGQRRDVVAGDAVLLPFADNHRFWNGATNEAIFASQVIQRGPVDGIWTVNYGGGGSETRMVCGFLESSEFLFAPLFRSLPELLVEHMADDAVGARITSTVQEMIPLVESATPGMQMMLGRMMEMLFTDMLRRHAKRLPANSTGWLAAASDPVVGRALQLIHADPARKWSAEELASEAGASRTVLGERFNALLGRPPIDYVTGWRMQLAADRLRNSREGIAAIAADVGYESEAAFNRAFKRVTGISPGRWREGDGDSPQLMPIQFGTPLVPDVSKPAG